MSALITIDELVRLHTKNRERGCRKFVVLGGHAHQPPRQGLDGIVPREVTASPYNDWNERAWDTCYRALSEAELYAGRRILNCFNLMSYDVSQPLLSWLHNYHPETLEKIRQADADSQRLFQGHGGAMVLLSPSHAILPLLDRASVQQHVEMSCLNFERNYGRKPEGAFFPECAVNDFVLQTASQAGIQWVVLSPHQAAQWRPEGHESWFDETGGGIDPRRPYRWQGPHGDSLVIFFYDGGISQDVAFNRENLLLKGEHVRDRLKNAFDWHPDNQEIQMVSWFVDMETFGLHHESTPLCQAWTQLLLLQDDQVQLSNYGEFLNICRQHMNANPHLAWWEVKIKQDSAWSCAHGLGRWSYHCSCPEAGSRHQHWREPLRKALGSYLPGVCNQLVQAVSSSYFPDFHKSLLHYDPDLLQTDSAADEFLALYAHGNISDDEKRQAMRLLEAAWRVVMAQNSCAYFFEELTRPEAQQCLLQAARFFMLSRLFGAEFDYENGFVNILTQAASNEPLFGDGRGLWQKLVQPKALVAELEMLLEINRLEPVKERCDRLKDVFDALCLAAGVAVDQSGLKESVRLALSRAQSEGWLIFPVTEPALFKRLDNVLAAFALKPAQPTMFLQLALASQVA